MKDEEKIIQPEEQEKFESNTSSIIILIIIFLVLTAYLVYKITNQHEVEQVEEHQEIANPYKITSNELTSFDIKLMQLNNNEKNIIYSPLSIKYALGMLNEGAEGKTKAELSALLGEYHPYTYKNSSHMSLANAMFIRNTFKNNIKESYTSNISDKYNAEIIYDEFSSPTNINNWVEEKTFNLIKDLVDDVSDKDYYLINTLAIDMEWVNKIEPVSPVSISYDHENYNNYIPGLISGYTNLNFNNMHAKSVEVMAVANKYDIIKDLGEEKIKQTVEKEYNEWLDKKECGSYISKEDPKEVANKFYEDLKNHYNKFQRTTDFYFYTDEEVKVFAKDLKEYDGQTLQYIGIMPTKNDLKTYIENTQVQEYQKIISNLKDTKLETFDEGYITEVKGTIPLFNYDYELDLKQNLTDLNITTIFNNDANLKGITDSKTLIGEAKHKAKIEFSNDGIKAAAATELGGLGAGGCYFNYKFDVPVKTIDLTFDKPYLYFIINKDTKEVWFAGTVYTPTEWEKQQW